MHTPTLAFIAGFVALAFGDVHRDEFQEIAARHRGHGYGHPFPFPPFPISKSTSGDPTVTKLSSLSTGSPTGITVGSVSPSGYPAGPYGNATSSLGGTAYSTGSLGYTSKDPNATVSGKPTPSSNATSITGISGNPTSVGTIGTVSATPVSASNITDPRYSATTHGPYPFPTSKRSYVPSGTVGSGISQSATGLANITSISPTDPLASIEYPTRGPYSRPTSVRPYPFSTSSVIGTSGTAISSSDPSTSPSISVNATIISASSGTLVPSGPSLTVGPPISANATSVVPSSGTGLSSTLDPSASLSYYSSGIAGGTGDPFPITASATTFDTSIKFSYTPTVKSQPSEYYYHHRKPHHHHGYGDGGYEHYSD